MKSILSLSLQVPLCHSCLYGVKNLARVFPAHVSNSFTVLIHASAYSFTKYLPPFIPLLPYSFGDDLL